LTKDFKFDERFKLPEELGAQAAYALLDEIFTGGVVDSSNQGLLLLLAALSSGDNISQVKLGRVTQ
jgi:RNA 3'-terminal phosphate cyclase